MHCGLSSTFFSPLPFFSRERRREPVSVYIHSTYFASACVEGYMGSWRLPGTKILGGAVLGNDSPQKRHVLPTKGIDGRTDYGTLQQTNPTPSGCHWFLRRGESHHFNVHPPRLLPSQCTPSVLRNSRLSAGQSHGLSKDAVPITTCAYQVARRPSSRLRREGMPAPAPLEAT